MRPADDRFVSKRDGWLVGVIWGSLALGAAALVPAALAVRDQPLTVAALAAGALALGIGPWVLFTTDYTFERDALAIRGGPFRWRVGYADIRSVEPSRDPRSSPACSLDRLRIQYGERWILVSPLDRGGFLRRLAEMCPQLRLEGDRLAAPR